MKEYGRNEAFNFYQGKAIKPKENLRLQVEQLLMSQVKIKIAKKQPVFKKSYFNSHFWGIPYFEQGEKWPTHVLNGEPLDFVCQFVNTGEFPFPDGIDIIQLYFSFYHLFGDEVDKAWHIKTYKNPSSDKYEYVPNPYGKVSKKFNPAYLISDVCLPDYATAASINPDIKFICKKINYRKPYLPYNKIANYLVGDKEYGSTVGGYPNWLYHETNFDKEFHKQGYHLLAQVDNECYADLCWGDVATAYLFYNPDNKNDFEFLLQKF